MLWHALQSAFSQKLFNRGLIFSPSLDLLRLTAATLRLQHIRSRFYNAGQKLIPKKGGVKRVPKMGLFTSTFCSKIALTTFALPPIIASSSGFLFSREVLSGSALARINCTAIFLYPLAASCRGVVAIPDMNISTSA